LTETSSRRIFNDALSLLAIYYCGDQMKNNEMGMEYDTLKRGEILTGLSWEIQKERATWKI